MPSEVAPRGKLRVDEAAGATGQEARASSTVRVHQAWIDGGIAQAQEGLTGPELSQALAKARMPRAKSSHASHGVRPSFTPHKSELTDAELRRFGCFRPVHVGGTESVPGSVPGV